MNTRTLAEVALEITNRDVAAAARLLAEWSGLSLEFAITVLDELVMLELDNEGMTQIVVTHHEQFAKEKKCRVLRFTSETFEWETKSEIANL